MHRGARVGAIASWVAVLVLASCAEDPRPADPRPSTPRAPESETTAERAARYEVIEVTETGTLRGNVRWRGDRPEIPDLEVGVHGEACGETQSPRVLEIASGGGVADVVVSIDARRGAALAEPPPPSVVDNVGCRFEPHLSVVGVGWPVTFRNSDEVMHNVHGFADDETVIDLGLPERGAEEQRAFVTAGAFRLVCDAGHTWQHAWIHAFEHPYFAKTGQDGRFHIARVPPGQYTLRVWHEGWRIVGRRSGRPRWSNAVVLSRAVSVSTEQETVVDFELNAQSGEIAGD